MAMVQVEYTTEFGTWWDGLDQDAQESVAKKVGLLEERGWTLGDPYSSDVKMSKYGAMRELKIQHKGQPFRVLYAIDPRQAALLLIGGNKGGDDRWYERFVPIADRLWEDHLRGL